MAFRNGNKKLSQQMMRARIVAQGGTIVAICYGAQYQMRQTYASQAQAPTK